MTSNVFRTAEQLVDEAIRLRREGEKSIPVTHREFYTLWNAPMNKPESIRIENGEWHLCGLKVVRDYER